MGKREIERERRVQREKPRVDSRFSESDEEKKVKNTSFAAKSIDRPRGEKKKETLFFPPLYLLVRFSLAPRENNPFSSSSSLSRSKKSKEKQTTMASKVASAPPPPSASFASKAPIGDGLKAYYQGKIEELELNARDKAATLRRLEAQRNELNSKGEEEEERQKEKEKSNRWRRK